MKERATQSLNSDIPPEIATAELEARNAIQQYDWAVAQIEQHVKAEGFTLDRQFLQELNRLAVIGIEPDAGKLRTYDLIITHAKHVPPPHDEVLDLVDELCAYVNKNWTENPIHLGAYLLWRVNWIHPFGDGNGRTSRMIAYAVLCIRLGFLLPGTNTIPDQIASNKLPYYDALAEADEAYADGRIDVTAMEVLLENLLAAQLVAVHDKAKGL